MYKLTTEMINDFVIQLREDEKARSTVERYSRDVHAFYSYAIAENKGKCQITQPQAEALVDKTTVLDYKRHLSELYAVGSVNTMLSSVNSLFDHLGWHELRVRALKVQKNVFAPKEKELTRREYERLLQAAEEMGNMRLNLAMQTICSTGIRISELKFITVESLVRGEARITCKGKQRCAFLPTILCKKLRKYCEEQKIYQGAVFISKNGKALDRSNIWSEMKRLCRAAGVSEEKVYPHNLRHLFARTYYTQAKDIVRLADILGHSSVNTTRIYTMESGDVHKRQIQKLGLVKE